MDFLDIIFIPMLDPSVKSISIYIVIYQELLCQKIIIVSILYTSCSIITLDGIDSMAIQDQSSVLNSEKVAVSVEDITKPGEPSIEIENKNADANTNSIPTRKVLLLIMLIAVVLIAVGAITVSLFATQHDWSTGRACLDCHQDVDDEFTNMGVTQPHEAMFCPDCHQDLGSGYDDEHGANLPQCISCHPTVETNITFDTEAHKVMYTEAGTYGFNQGGNDIIAQRHALK